MQEGGLRLFIKLPLQPGLVPRGRIRLDPAKSGQCVRVLWVLLQEPLVMSPRGGQISFPERDGGQAVAGLGVV